MLQLLLRLQLLQQHPRLGKAFVGPVEARHQPQGGLQQHGGVVAGQGQPGAGGLAVEAGGEGAGAGEHGDAPGPLPLAAQLFRRPHHVAGHRLAQLRFLADRLAEAAAHAGFPLGGRGLLQGQAAHPLQLQLQAHPHHPRLGPQLTAGHVAQVAGVGDAPQPAPAAQLTAHPPHLLHGGALQPGGGVAAAAQVEHPGVVAVGLGHVVGELGQHLAGGQADGDRQAQVVADAAAQGAGPAVQIAVAGPGQPGEGLVD